MIWLADEMGRAENFYKKVKEQTKKGSTKAKAEKEEEKLKKKELELEIEKTKKEIEGKGGYSGIKLGAGALFAAVFALVCINALNILTLPFTRVLILFIIGTLLFGLGYQIITRWWQIVIGIVVVLLLSSFLMVQIQSPEYARFETELAAMFGDFFKSLSDAYKTSMCAITNLQNTSACLKQEMPTPPSIKYNVFGVEIESVTTEPIAYIGKETNIMAVIKNKGDIKAEGVSAEVYGTVDKITEKPIELDCNGDIKSISRDTLPICEIGDLLPTDAFYVNSVFKIEKCVNSFDYNITASYKYYTTGVVPIDIVSEEEYKSRFVFGSESKTKPSTESSGGPVKIGLAAGADYMQPLKEETNTLIYAFIENDKTGIFKLIKAKLFIPKDAFENKGCKYLDKPLAEESEDDKWYVYTLSEDYIEDKDYLELMRGEKMMIQCSVKTKEINEPSMRSSLKMEAKYNYQTTVRKTVMFDSASIVKCRERTQSGGGGAG